jgi:hypothetical protein
MVLQEHVGEGNESQAIRSCKGEASFPPQGVS